MEKTSDRDYEVEERWVNLADLLSQRQRQWLFTSIVDTVMLHVTMLICDIGDIARWKPPPTNSRKKPKDTSIPCVVSMLVAFPGTSARDLLGPHPESWPPANDGHTMPAMTASQIRIAETIDAFYGDAGTRDGVSRAYKQAVVDLDAETIKALDGPYRCVSTGSADMEPPTWKLYSERIIALSRTTVLEPISRFCAYFPDINECMQPTSFPFFSHPPFRRADPVMHCDPRHAAIRSSAATIQRYQEAQQ